MGSGSISAEPAEGKIREKKSKKRVADSDGVHKPKKDKKEKKQKREKLAQALDEHLQASAAASAAEELRAAKDESSEDEKPATAVVRGALVSFAVPIANEKHQKKLYKCVKKAAKQHAILRGVKEVNKALRKAPPRTPSTSHITPGAVIVAGDISPAEVIMHIPLACEEANAPYMFVPSRAELGAAAKTKRPTSVIMLLPKGKKGKGADEDPEAEKEYAEAYADAVKMLQKEYTKQMRGMI